MLSNQDNNWAVNIPSEDFMRIRQLMIDCVLSTDMSSHLVTFNKIKERVTKPDFSLKDENDK
jgi:3'5'-cyclic nucleotide phosphodiesterase